MSLTLRDVIIPPPSLRQSHRGEGGADLQPVHVSDVERLDWHLGLVDGQVAVGVSPRDGAQRVDGHVELGTRPHEERSLLLGFPVPLHTHVDDSGLKWSHRYINTTVCVCWSVCVCVCV